jgi:uncharacterized membrane protein
MMLSATGVALFSLRYLLPKVPFPARLTNVLTHREALTIHASAASVALLVGPWQFVSVLRDRHLNLHRALGVCYAAAVLTGWLASITVALHAQTGLAASAGFLALGACWVTATATAIWKVTHGDIAAHRRWMIRSYALTAAGITLRIYLGAALALHLPFVVAYPVIAWACWVPNALIAEQILRLPR